MRRAALAALALLLAALLAACSPPPPAPQQAPPDGAVRASVTIDAGAPAAAAAAPTKKLHMQLRSTPPGADVAVDGRPAGTTPTTADLDDDGREHEFTFVLPGYRLERYRTRVVQSSTVHAAMHALTDAGP